jgi:hypothetical protein
MVLLILVLCYMVFFHVMVALYPCKKEGTVRQDNQHNFQRLHSENNMQILEII